MRTGWRDSWDRLATEPADRKGRCAFAVGFVERLGRDLQDRSCPIEVRSLGRTLLRWKDQIAAWHKAQVGQGPTEGINNLVKRVKRAASG